MLPTGRSTFLENKDWAFGDPEEVPGITYYEYRTWDGMFTAWAESAYRQSSGTVGAYPSEPHWECVKHEGGWEQWEIRPSIHASNGSHMRDLVPATGEYFEVDGKKYSGVVYPQPDTFFVFDRGDTSALAWSVSPCTELPEGVPATMYTHPDNKYTYGQVDEDGLAFTPLGRVERLDTAVYSINSWGDDVYRYWSKDIEVDYDDDDAENYG